MPEILQLCKIRPDLTLMQTKPYLPLLIGLMLSPSSQEILAQEKAADSVKTLQTVEILGELKNRTRVIIPFLGIKRKPP